MEVYSVIFKSKHAVSEFVIPIAIGKDQTITLYGGQF